MAERSDTEMWDWVESHHAVVGPITEEIPENSGLLIEWWQCTTEDLGWGKGPTPRAAVCAAIAADQPEEEG